MNRCVFIKDNNCILCKQISKLPVTGSVLDILTPHVDWWIASMKFCKVFSVANEDVLFFVVSVGAFFEVV